MEPKSLVPFERATVSSLVSLLGSGDVDVCRLAIHALVEIGAEVVPALMNALASSSLWVKSNACAALLSREFDLKHAIPGLLDELLQCRVRTAAGLPQQEWFYNKLTTVRLVTMLGRMGRRARAAAPVLFEALTDEDVEVCIAAAEALGRMGRFSLPGVPLLQGLLAHEDRNVRCSAEAALEAIRRYGPDEGQRPAA